MQPIAFQEIKNRIERDNPWWTGGAELITVFVLWYAVGIAAVFAFGALCATYIGG